MNLYITKPGKAVCTPIFRCRHNFDKGRQITESPIDLTP
jgi:hypothetical protein